MSWEKARVVLGAIGSVPIYLVLGAMLGHFFFMHFVFTTEIQEFTPGDAIGEMLFAGIGIVCLLFLGSGIWIYVYRRISRRPAGRDPSLD